MSSTRVAVNQELWTAHIESKSIRDLERRHWRTAASKCHIIMVAEVGQPWTEVTAPSTIWCSVTLKPIQIGLGGTSFVQAAWGHSIFPIVTVNCIVLVSSLPKYISNPLRASLYVMRLVQTWMYEAEMSGHHSKPTRNRRTPSTIHGRSYVLHQKSETTFSLAWIASLSLNSLEYGARTYVGKIGGFRVCAKLAETLECAILLGWMMCIASNCSTRPLPRQQYGCWSPSNSAPIIIGCRTGELTLRIQGCCSVTIEVNWRVREQEVAGYTKTWRAKINIIWTTETQFSTPFN